MAMIDAVTIANPALAAGADQSRGGSLKQVVPAIAALAVAVITLLTIRFGHGPQNLLYVWFANALAVGIWLRAPRSRNFDILFGAMIFLGILAPLILTGQPFELAVGEALANLAEIVIAVIGLRRFAPRSERGTVRWTFKLLTVLTVTAPLLGAGLLALLQRASVTEFMIIWFAHSLGLLALTPVVLFAERSVVSLVFRPLRLLEWIGWVGGFVVVIWFARVQGIWSIAVGLNVLIAVVAARLRAPGVCLALTLGSIVMFAGIALNPDKLPPPEQIPAILADIQLTAITIGGAYLYMAALLFERDELARTAAQVRAATERASEAKSRLLANVAHEIKSPIGGVIGIAELWSSEQLGPITPKQKEMADMLIATAKQVHMLSHDLLDVAKAEAGEISVDLRPTDVFGVLDDIGRIIQLRPDAQALTIKVQASPGLMAMADSQRLNQVLTNLASNAVKYGRAGGEVALRAHQLGSIIRIEVADKGLGISPAKQSELFEPFNRLGMERSSVEGHGIGLALARRLIEAQNGEIGVVSIPDEGATFWVQLPAA